MRDLNKMSVEEKLTHLEFMCQRIEGAAQSRLELLKNLKDGSNLSAEKSMVLTTHVLKDIINWDVAFQALHSSPIPQGEI